MVTAENATRWCHDIGEWDYYTNYSACQTPRYFLELPPDTGVEVATTLYAAGYILSLAALGVAVWIFTFFK